MKNTKPFTKSFTATLRRTGNRLNWVVIRMPFDAEKFWGRRGQIQQGQNLPVFVSVA